MKGFPSVCLSIILASFLQPGILAQESERAFLILADTETQSNLSYTQLRQHVEAKFKTLLSQAGSDYYDAQSLKDLISEDQKILTSQDQNDSLSNQQIKLINQHYDTVSTYIRYRVVYNEGIRYKFVLQAFDVSDGHILFSLASRYFLMENQGSLRDFQEMLNQALTPQIISQLTEQEAQNYILMFHNFHQDHMSVLYQVLKGHSISLKLLELSDQLISFELRPKSYDSLAMIFEQLKNETSKKLGLQPEAIASNVRGNRYDFYLK